MYRLILVWVAPRNNFVITCLFWRHLRLLYGLLANHDRLLGKGLFLTLQLATMREGLFARGDGLLLRRCHCARGHGNSRVAEVCLQQQLLLLIEETAK